MLHEGHQQTAWDKANYVGYYAALGNLKKSVNPIDIHPAYQTRWSKVIGTLKECRDRVKTLFRQLKPRKPGDE